MLSVSDWVPPARSPPRTLFLLHVQDFGSPVGAECFNERTPTETAIRVSRVTFETCRAEMNMPC